MAGGIFAVVGPSGVGKDSLMEAAKAARPDLHLVRRVITRPTSAGGEDFEGISPEAFAARKEAGAFILSWEAHGLSYAIPYTVERAINEGRDVLFNGSRGVLGEAWEAFPGLVVIHVTASVASLARRLAARGRETEDEIAKRLTRADYGVPYGMPVRVVENNGTLEDATQRFLSALQPERG